MLALLMQVLRGSPLSRTPVEWDGEKESALKAAKEALQRVTNLAFPREWCQACGRFRGPHGGHPATAGRHGGTMGVPGFVLQEARHHTAEVLGL